MFKNGAIKAALALLATAILVFGARKAFADQSDADDPYSVNYFVNAHTVGGPDTLRIVDPDPINDSELPPACANIFVFDSAQELQECCACPVTPAGRLDFNVNTQLTNNPASPGSIGGVLTTGTIKIVKTNVNTCNPLTTPGCLLCDATNNSGQPPISGGAAFTVCGEANPLCPGPALFSWITHDLNKFNPSAVSEAEFQSTNEGTIGQAPLPNGDLIDLQKKCLTARRSGLLHGNGVCTCPAGPIP